MINKLKNIMTYNLLLALSLILGFIVILGLILKIEQKDCESKWRDYNGTWGAWSECRINFDGKMTPVSKVEFNIHENVQGQN